jgi:hypothetical protein
MPGPLLRGASLVWEAEGAAVTDAETGVATGAAAGGATGELTGAEVGADGTTSLFLATAELILA